MENGSGPGEGGAARATDKLTLGARLEYRAQIPSLTFLGPQAPGPFPAISSMERGGGLAWGQSGWRAGACVQGLRPLLFPSKCDQCLSSQ